MRWQRLVMALAFCGVFSGLAHGQEPTRVTLGTGAGASVPLGDLGDIAKLGWMAQANFGVRPSAWPVGLRLDVSFHSMGGDDDVVGAPDDLAVITGVVNLELGLAQNAAGGGLFASAGAGVYRFEFDDTAGGETESSDFGVAGGLAYKIAMTNLFVSLEGKFHHAFTEGDATQFASVAVVAEIPIGGS